MRMKKHPQFFISKSTEVPGVGITIGIDLGEIWSHYCTLNEDGEVIDRGRFRTNAAGLASNRNGIVDPSAKSMLLSFLRRHHFAPWLDLPQSICRTLLTREGA